MPTSRKGEVLLNEQGHKVWRPDGPTGGQCLWEMHGVWGFDIKKKEGVVLRESYFLKHPATGNKVGSKGKLCVKVGLTVLYRLIGTTIVTIPSCGDGRT